MTVLTLCRSLTRPTACAQVAIQLAEVSPDRRPRLATIRGPSVSHVMRCGTARSSDRVDPTGHHGRAAAGMGPSARALLTRGKKNDPVGDDAGDGGLGGRLHGR